MKSKHQWIVRLWRIVFLFLGFAALALGSLSWILTDNPKSMFLTICAFLSIIFVAYGVYTEFSVNIFGRRIRKLQARSERLFIYMSALGLYLAVVGAIFYGTSFLLLKIMQIPSIIVQAIATGEVVVFSVVGIIGFIRLRRLIQWLFAEGDRSIERTHTNRGWVR